MRTLVPIAFVLVILAGCTAAVPPTPTTAVPLDTSRLVMRAEYAALVPGLTVEQAQAVLGAGKPLTVRYHSEIPWRGGTWVSVSYDYNATAGNCSQYLFVTFDNVDEANGHVPIGMGLDTTSIREQGCAGIVK